MKSRSITSVANPILISAFLLSIIGCAGTPVEKGTIETFKPPPRVDLTDSELIKRLLYSQLKEWRGVKYRLGGLSKSGIDCSGFTQITFLTKFGIALPRTSRSQARIGEEMPDQEPKPGDLVFFKVGADTQHVGIFLEKRRFIHASASQGVTISSLDNPYWAKRYWKFKRIAQ
jgi:NlpC/P60 family